MVLLPERLFQKLQLCIVIQLLSKIKKNQHYWGPKHSLITQGLCEEVSSMTEPENHTSVQYVKS